MNEAQNPSNEQCLPGTTDTGIDLLSVKHVSRVLGCSTRTVYRLADAGKMPLPVRLGSLVRWSRKALEDWIAQGCPPIRPTRGGSR